MKPSRILLIADSRASCREHFISFPSPKKEESIKHLLLSLECKIEGDYFDALDLVNYLKKGVKPFKQSIPPNHEDYLLLSNTISLGGIFLFDYLSKNGYQVDYIANFFTEKAKLPALIEKKPLAVLISSTFFNVRQLIEIIDFLVSCQPGIPIIVGGQLIDYLAHFQKYTLQFNKKIFKNVILLWEAKGERTLLRLLSVLNKGKSWENIPNLIYFKEGNYYETARERENQGIDHHMISWDQISEEYLRDYAPIQTSAGCPFNCTFCTFAKLHRKINLKSVDFLEKELSLIAARDKVKHLMFVDDLVAISKSRLKEIATIIERNNFPFTWSALLRSDSIVDREMAKLLKRSGLSLANLGIESFDQGILDNMRKRTTPANHFRAIELLKNEGIFVNGFFVFGFPGETETSIERTIQGIIQSEIDLCEVHLWNNIPGAPIYDSKDYDLKGSYSDWRHKTMNALQCMHYIVEVFKKVSYQFGMLDDNVLPLVMMQTEGYSNKQIKEVFRTKSSLVMNQLKLNEGRLTKTQFNRDNNRLLTHLKGIVSPT
jgi:radical SAM superfamily enzyme YgiQ (UPF0313 family)